jgi:hypothetical protein
MPAEQFANFARTMPQGRELQPRTARQGSIRETQRRLDLTYLLVYIIYLIGRSVWRNFQAISSSSKRPSAHHRSAPRNGHLQVAPCSGRSSDHQFKTGTNHRLLPAERREKFSIISLIFSDPSVPPDCPIPEIWPQQITTSLSKNSSNLRLTSPSQWFTFKLLRSAQEGGH